MRTPQRRKSKHNRPRQGPRCLRYIDALPNELFRAVVGGDTRRLNATAMGRALNKDSCSIWHYIRGYRRWPADEWLRAMMLVGGLQEAPDHFQVVLPKTLLLCRIFDELRGLPFLREPPAPDPDTDDYIRAAPPLPDEWEEFLDGTD